MCHEKKVFLCFCGQKSFVRLPYITYHVNTDHYSFYMNKKFKGDNSSDYTIHTKSRYQTTWHNIQKIGHFINHLLHTTTTTGWWYSNKNGNLWIFYGLRFISIFCWSTTTQEEPVTTNGDLVWPRLKLNGTWAASFIYLHPYKIVW